MKTISLSDLILRRRSESFGEIWVVPRYTLILVLISLCVYVSAHHPPSPTSVSSKQQIQEPITGTVYDAGGPIPGVTVQIKGTYIATFTQDDGTYLISATAGDILVFIYSGYETVEAKVEDQSVINIELFETIALEEAVINAGYYTVKDKERTGSISKITSKDIEIQPVTNVLAALQGRMAGVEILQETGVPGGGFNLKIRGQNSLRVDGNSPLYVIDGVPYSSEAIGSFLTSNTLFPSLFSPLNSINPESIESIEVLKDADATAIYGSRGANGVVLITTKKGKGGKTQVSINTSAGVGRVTSFIDLMDTEQYLKMRTQAFENDGILEYPPFAYDINGAWNSQRYTDWQKELIGGTAEMNTINASVSGGSEFTQFLAGANYNFQSTVFPGKFNYKKNGVYMNVRHKSTDNRFSFSLSGNYNIQNNLQPSSDLTVISRNLAPNAPALYDENGDLNWENNTWTNPLANLKGVSRLNTNDLIANLVLSYQLLPYLEFKASSGFTDTRHQAHRTAPSTVFNPSFGLGPEYSALFLNNVDRQSWILEPQLSFGSRLGRGELKVLVGSSFQHQNSQQINEYGIGFTSNDLINDLASASTKIVALSNKSIYKYQAFYGRINYNWDERYILNLTGRRDGSSRFGSGNQFAYFGAVGAAWIFSNENFLFDHPVLNFGKLRISYGTSGNDQIGDYQFLDTYSTGEVYQGITGLSPSRIYNPYFRWETNKKFETGLELGFFKDRIFLTSSYYRNRSSNQLVGIPLPGTTGFSSMQANLDAVVENTGYEFSLRTINIDSDNFNWSSNLNITFPNNKLVSFPELESSTYKEMYRIGKPLHIELVYHFLGIDPETGVYQFSDVNEDGQITSPEDKQTVVDLSPVFYGGIQNVIQYKQWSLSFLLQFTKQKNRAFLGGTPGTMNNQPSEFIQSWQFPGQNSPYQIFTSGLNQEAVTAHSLYTESDAAIVDGSYIRLKNISLSYQMPISLFDLQCRIYVEAQNLLTITSYKYGDPEFSQLGFLPPLRVVSAGIQLTF